MCEVAIDKIFCGSDGNHHDPSSSVSASKMESVNYVSATTNANCSASECRWIYSIEYNVSHTLTCHGCIILCSKDPETGP